MVALLDIDGVVLNLQEGIKHSLYRYGIEYKPENCISYSFEGDIGCDKDWVFSLFRGTDVYENSPLYDGVIEAVKKLKSVIEVRPYTIVANVKDVVDKRLDLLESLGLTRFTYTGTTKPVMNNVDFLFEDNPLAVKEWLSTEYNGYILVIRQPYNSYLEEELQYSKKVVFCNSFVDAVDYVCDRKLYLEVQ